MPDPISNDRKALIKWYKTVRRALPWRAEAPNPYHIWISEVMLQQTTVAAVIPYYHKFLERFPTVEVLAKSDVSAVLEAWAGLGYYSRARNLHRSAQEIVARGGFPQTHLELLKLHGFGPYTARAVASLAFGEKVGVLDGNVIRVLSRRYGMKSEWWKPKPRAELQKQVDALAQTTEVSELNQGLMELGATVCTPRNPACLICPWISSCVAHKTAKQLELPLPKPRRASEIWLWTPQVFKKKGHVLLQKNEYAPFLKGHLIPPGKAEKLKSKPKTFDLRGSVTHHDIYIKLSPSNTVRPQGASQWLSLAKLKSAVPSSLVRKIISYSTTSALAILILSCKSAVKTEPQVVPLPGPPKAVVASLPPIDNKESATGPAHSVTALGHNKEPAISQDGKRLLYISGGRPEHVRGQVYELDIEAKLERRVTFHDGEDFNPEFISSKKGVSDRILYSSDTDEVKELDFSVQAAQQKYGLTAPPANSNNVQTRGELYLQSLDGKFFERITKSPGYDGDPSADAKGRKFAFVSSREGHMRLYIMEGHVQKLGITPDKGFRIERVALSGDGRLVAWQTINESVPGSWLQFAAPPYKQAQNATGLSVPEGSEIASQDVEPSWHPNHRDIVFSSNRGDGKVFNIWLAGTDGGECLKRLTQSTCQQRQPVLSPDGKYLYFASDCSGSWQIYRAEVANNTACWTPPSKLR